MSIWSSLHGIDGDWCDDPGRPGKCRNTWDPCPGCWECTSGAPWVYFHSAEMPEEHNQRGGSVDLAVLSSFVKHARDHGGDQGTDFVGLEPWLRFGVRDQGGDSATVILNPAQVRHLVQQLTEWADRVEAS